jgi:uncharacterized protein (TIGR02300 family)
MTKPELGTKRACTECGARYYDLNMTPITCPKCGAPLPVVETKTVRRSAPPAAVRNREAAPLKAEPTSPDSKDTLIEELDEDGAEVSEIMDGKDKDQGDT